jgi:excisionase family DNA binding protein
MPQFGLREAARQVGVTKSTIHRAVQQGRLSASRTEGGGYAIDAAELFRVYPPKAPHPRDVARQSADGGEGHGAPSPERDDGTDGTDLRVRNARLEAENEALRASVASEKEKAASERRLFEDALQEARAQRDKWQQQAERLALAPPKIERLGWWPFRRALN